MKEELILKIADLTKEIRSIADEFGDTSKDVKDIECRMAAKKAELDQAKKDLAQMEMPKEDRAKGLHLTNEEFILAAKEQRTITIGGTGKINQVRELFETVGEKDDILEKVTYDYGDNASTAIPVLEPGLGEPTETAEGGTVSDDDQAALQVTEIMVACQTAVLPITAEALQTGSVNIEGKLPELFRKAFRKKLHKNLFIGTLQNSSMKGTKGIFVSAAANTSGKTEIAGTSIKITELAGLALTLSELDEDYEILMNKTTYQNMMADSTDGEDIKIYKEGLIRNKEIEGIKVRLDSKAPKATSAGAILAAGVPLSRYHVGVAGQINITPIKVKGDTKTYFQAEAFFGGKQVSDSDIYSLAVAANS